MFRNYLKIAFRNMRKRAGFSAINIFGLSIAIAVSLMMFTTSIRELSYDNFHENVDDLHALYFHEVRHDRIDMTRNMMMPLMPALKDEFPELIGGTRILDTGGAIEKDGKIIDMGGDYVDEDFLKMFSFPIIHGDTKTPLENLGSAVFSRESAEKVFGKVDAVGETFKLKEGDRTKEYIVSAITEEMPYHSSIRFNFVIRIENSEAFKNASWDSSNHNAFVQLPKTVSEEQFEDRLKPFVARIFGDDMERLIQDGAQADADGEVFYLRLHPLRSLHFATHLGGGINKTFPIGLLLVGIFILAIACINFVNLTLGTSVTRALEVGVRKVLGAMRSELIMQFFGEALIVILISSVIGLMLVQWFLPEYNAFFRHDIAISDSFILTSVGIILIIVTLIAGGYPSLALSRFQAADVLKKNTKFQKPGFLRNMLVVVQFAISILLICATMILSQQMEYMRNLPLGFNQSEVVSIPIGNEISGKRAVDLFRNKMGSNPNIESITTCDGNMGMGLDGSRYTSIYGFIQDDREMHTHWLFVDHDFLKTLDLTLLDGKVFEPMVEGDTIKKVIINQRLANQISPDQSPVGTMLNVNPPREIIGVVKDFHFQPLHKPIDNMTLAVNPYDARYIFAKINAQNIPETITAMESAWKDIAPRSEFQASFLDENMERQYKAESTMSDVFKWAGALAVLLSCLGLFGIAILVIVRRTKEIGIRKVLGASTATIVALLSKDFLKLVLISAIIATPLSYYGMGFWLQEFHYRIDMPIWVFIVATIMALLIAFGTVGFQSIRAAMANPVHSLRSE